MNSILLLIGIGIYYKLTNSQALKLSYNQENLTHPAPIEQEEKEGLDDYLDFLNTGGKPFDWKTKYSEKRRARAELRNNQAQSKPLGYVPPSLEAIGGKLYGKWKERGASNVAGRIILADVLEEKNFLALGTMGGNVLIGDLEGNDFKVINDKFQFKIRGLHTFKLNSNEIRIVVVDESGVYYSDNQGATWTKTLSNVTLGQSVYSRASSQIYSISLEGDLWTSTDLGESFTKVGSVEAYKNYGNRTFLHIWTPRYVEGDLYLLSKEKVYAYNGNSIQYRGTIQSAQYFTDYLISGDHFGDNLIAAFNDKFYESSDGGRNWQFVSNEPTSPFTTSKLMTATNIAYADNQVRYVGGVELNRSDDGGKTWKRVNSWSQYYTGENRKTMFHSDILDIKIFKDSSDQTFTLISSDGGTYISYNDKNYLNITLDGTPNSQYYGTLTRWDDPDYVLAGAQDQGMQLSMPDSGREIMKFIQVGGGDKGALTSSDSGKSAWYTYIMGSLYYHPDTRYKDSWSPGKPKGGEGFMWMSATMADPKNPQKVYIGGNKIYYSQYNESQHNFTSGAHSNIAFEGDVTALEYSPHDDNIWYVATNERNFYKSTDRGLTWTLKNSNIAETDYLVGQDIVVDPLIPGRIYLCGNGNDGPSVFVSNDGGDSFTELANSPTTTTVKMAVTPDSKYIFAATITGPYVYITENNQWYDLSGYGAPDNQYFSVEYIPTIQTARFGTFGRGIWDFTIEDESTTTLESTADKYTVEPFSIEGRNIQFNHNQNSTIDGGIYTLKGEKVQEFERKQHQPFSKIQVTNAVKPNQHYFIRLNINGEIYSKKTLFNFP